MPFPDDLLDLAVGLALKDSEPNQATLRRAVSTAYYALFHLLVEAASAKWPVERQRPAFARTFEHSRMKAACQEFHRLPDVPPNLGLVAKNFVLLQESRHSADYDSSRSWDHEGALAVVALAADAFEAWSQAADHDAADDLLFRLFVRFPR